MFSQSDLDRNKPCPICGQSNYEWGFLTVLGYRRGDTFKVFSGRGGYSVMRVRRCLTCDNVQHFMDEAATKRLKMTTYVIVGIVLVIMVLIFLLPLYFQ